MITYSFDGRLTKDAEYRTLQSGTSVLKLTVACNVPKKEAKYYYCDIYGKIADSLRPYLTKGKSVSVLGSPNWTKKEDGTVFETITVYNISLLGSKEETSEPREERTEVKPAQRQEVQYDSKEMKRQNEVMKAYNEPPMYSDEEIKEAEAREFNKALDETFDGKDIPF